MTFLSTPQKTILDGPATWHPWLHDFQALANTLDAWEALDPTSVSPEPLVGEAPPREPRLSDYPKSLARRGPEPRALRSQTVGSITDDLAANLPPQAPPGENLPLPYGAADYYRAETTADLSEKALKHYVDSSSLYRTMKATYQERKKAENTIVLWMQSTIIEKLRIQCCPSASGPAIWIRNLYERFRLTRSMRRQRANQLYIDHLAAPHDKRLTTRTATAEWFTTWVDNMYESRTVGLEAAREGDLWIHELLRSLMHSPLRSWAESRRTTIGDDWDDYSLDKAVSEITAAIEQIPEAVGRGRSAQGAFAVEKPNPRDSSKRRGDDHNDINPKRSRSEATSASPAPYAPSAPICPACSMRHRLEDCFYAFPERAFDGWKPLNHYRERAERNLANDKQLIKRVREIRGQ